MISKVCRIGTVQVGYGKHKPRRASVYIHATFKDGKFSVSGVVGPLASGNALGGCGQIDMEFAHRNGVGNDGRYSKLTEPSDISFAPGWDSERWLDLLDVWHKWHLNDMVAGCEHQEREKRITGANFTTQGLAAICPECGYSYGSRWNRREVPASVIEFIESLPDADQQPAWV